MTAYIPVVFAFLIFSSSPYEVVYWIPDQTIAPMAKSAPNPITFWDILITSDLMAVTPPHHTLGSIAFAGVPAHSLR
jgi:hypothetical protein